MPNVDKSSYFGIIRSTSRLKIENETIDQNITNKFSKASSGCRAILLNNVKHFISICASMGSMPDIIYKTGSGAFFGKGSILFRTDF
jgi:hypothetical protein